jgi:hypothetical protein
MCLSLTILPWCDNDPRPTETLPALSVAQHQELYGLVCEKLFFSEQKEK